MASSLLSNLATNSDKSGESKKKRKKKNQILNQQNRDQQNQNKNRRKTDVEQQIYPSKILQALRQVQLSPTSSSSSSLSSLAPKVRVSFAVVKKSEDPSEDFKRSMLEMILEKQMFEVKDLEELLHYFLLLNSRQHHVVIIEAFSEIWEVLFSKSPVMNRRDSKNS